MLLRVVDAAEVRERVEVVERALVDVADDAAVERLGLGVVAAVEVDRAAEEQRVAEEVGVEERLVLVEQAQRFLEEMQRVVVILRARTSSAP